MELKNKILAAASAAVIALVMPLTMKSEGRVLKTYRDPVGIPTICDGHTGRDVSMGQLATPEMCDELLKADLTDALADVDRCTPGLPTGPRAAFTDFTFNAGGEKFCKSTMAAKARAGDIAGACAELSRWVYAGGRVLPGLVTRRAAERALCEGRA